MLEQPADAIGQGACIARLHLEAAGMFAQDGSALGAIWPDPEHRLAGRQDAEELARKQQPLPAGQQRDEVGIASIEHIRELFTRLVAGEHDIARSACGDAALELRLRLALADEEPADAVIVLEGLDGTGDRFHVVADPEVAGVEDREAVTEAPGIAERIVGAGAGWECLCAAPDRDHRDARGIGALAHDDLAHAVAQHHDAVTVPQAEAIDRLERAPEDPLPPHQARRAGDVGIQVHRPVDDLRTLHQAQEHAHQRNEGRRREADHHVMALEREAAQRGGGIEQGEVEGPRRDPLLAEELHAHAVDRHAAVAVAPLERGALLAVDRAAGDGGHHIPTGHQRSRQVIGVLGGRHHIGPVGLVEQQHGHLARVACGRAERGNDLAYRCRG